MQTKTVDGAFELFHASLRGDSIDVVASKPLYEDVAPQVAWANVLAGLFHHVVDAAVEFGGLSRERTIAGLHEALTSITRAPSIGELRSCVRASTLPLPMETSMELVRARVLPTGRTEMTLGGLGWTEDRYRNWAQLIYDLVHAASRLESLAPERLMQLVVEEIDQPRTRFQGGRSRVSNILPRGDRSCWVSIPRAPDDVFVLCRLDLALVARAPVEGLGLAVEVALRFSPDDVGVSPTDSEDERLDDLLRDAAGKVAARDAKLVARIMSGGEQRNLFYVSNEATAKRLANALPDARVTQVADPTWSRFLSLKPDREELRRLANWNWLDRLTADEVDVDGEATVQHAFWPTDADARDRLVEFMTDAAFRLVSSDDSTARTELLFEGRLDNLRRSIDDVTFELEAHALEIGAVYDGWDIARSARAPKLPNDR